jgi:hypothetical protein
MSRRPGSYWLLWLLAATGCAASGPEANAPGDEDVGDSRFIDDDGTVKSWGGGSRAPSRIGLADDVVVLRCRISTEGEFFGCSRLRGPRVAEDRLVASLKRVRVQPVYRDGEPVEVWTKLMFRVRFVMP